jgi:predicted phage tail component-like protein
MGFTLNGEHSSQYGVYFKTKSMPYIPEKRSVSVQVQGRDGAYVFEDDYNNIQIEIACVIINSKVLYRRKSARDITKWLSQTGILIFDYEPDIEYKVVKITNNISAVLEGASDYFNIVFECLPYQEQTFYNDDLQWNEATLNWEHVNIPWGGYDRTFNVSSGQTIQVVNAGNYKALPTVKLTGVASSVSFGGFTFSNLNGTVYIDSVNKVVYSLSGSNKVNKISSYEGDFIELIPGVNDFTVSGTITNLTVEFDYKNTYM